MKKTTSLLAALLLAGGMNAKPYQQAVRAVTTQVAPVVTTIAPVPGSEQNTTTPSVEAAIVTKQLQSAEAQVELAQANAAQAQAALQGASQSEAAETLVQAAQEAGGTQAGYAVSTSAPGGQNPFGGGNFYNFDYGGQPFAFNSAEQPHSALVVRTSETSPETLTAMKEDLNIMGRILEKAISKSDNDDDQARAMGIRLTGIVSGGGAKFLQIEGSGALFLLNVDFPLLGPPEKAPAEKPAAANSSTWNEAKQELYGHPEGDGVAAAGRPEFDSKRVDRLKTTVLEALKNAGNMSHLPESETVTVVVNGGSPHGRGTWYGMGGGGLGGGFSGSMGSGSFGRGSGNGSWSATAPTAAGAASGGSTTLGGGGGGFGGGGAAGGLGGGGGGGVGASSNNGYGATSGPKEKKSPQMRDRLQHVVARARDGSSGVMTIRVSKTDIDAFVGGKIDLDDFRKKATITVY